MTIKSITTDNILIARDVSESDQPILLYDSKQLKEDLVRSNVFAGVESIEVGDNLLTIIGKNIKNYNLESFQVELIKFEGGYYFPNPNNPDLPKTTFAKHECSGSPCSSCDFIRRGGRLSAITGCDCKDEVGDGDDKGKCNHKKSGQDVLDTAKDVIDTATKVFGLFK